MYQSVQVSFRGRQIMLNSRSAADELIAAGMSALENWCRWSKRGAAAYGQHSPGVPWAELFDSSTLWDSAEERAADVETEMPVNDAAAERVEALILAMPDDLRRVVLACYLSSATSQQSARKLRLAVQEYRTAVLSGCRWIGRALLAGAVSTG